MFVECCLFPFRFVSLVADFHDFFSPSEIRFFFHHRIIFTLFLHLIITMEYQKKFKWLAQKTKNKGKRKEMEIQISFQVDFFSLAALIFVPFDFDMRVAYKEQTNLVFRFELVCFHIGFGALNSILKRSMIRSRPTKLNLN